MNFILQTSHILQLISIAFLSCVEKKKKSHLELIDEDEADHFVAEQKQLFVAAYKHQHKPLLECIAITKKKT